MIHRLLKLKLRKNLAVFLKKKINATDANWVRQVRKFSSDFLYKEKKQMFLNLFSKYNLEDEFKIPNKVSFKKTRKIPVEFVENQVNRKTAGKNASIFKKFKKFSRMKKTSKKFRGLAFYNRFPGELFRENPLTRFYNSNIELLSFNYNYLLNFHSAIGNSSRSWINPSVFSKILAIRNDMILYDLSFTFIALKKGLQSIFQVSKFKGSVLGFVNLEKNYKFSGVGFDHFLRSWLPGYLTNFKQVMKNILSLQTKNIFNLSRRQKKFLNNIDLRRKLPSNFSVYFWNRKFRGKAKITKIPAVPSFGFSLDDYSIWINECQKVGLRTMTICDSESFPHKVDYPIIANQKSLPLSFFLVKLVSETVSSGKRFDYFSFIGFQFISNVFKRTNKVDDRLLKKMSYF